ncbi:MAG: VOC family protein [Pseudomonadaceae bacterium]|nr:VOC family protein [Pseudomonadaceae bacterium]
MKIESLGHVVLNVSDLQRAERFYTDVLGMSVCARFNEQGMNMIFFSLGDHHDLALSEVSDEGIAGGQSSGLNHVAFRIGTEMKQLVEAKNHLLAQGLELTPVDHEVTKSLYFDDPDGNTVEVYVDVSSSWQDDPQKVAQAQPLEI